MNTHKTGELLFSASPSLRGRGSGLLRVPQLFATATLFFYRFAISPLLVSLFGPACRFEPSCSQFSSDAIRMHGLLRGGAMALRRLMRCHPMGGHGYDPVPVKR